MYYFFWAHTFLRKFTGNLNFSSQKADEALKTGEGLGGIEEETAGAEPTADEFAALKAKKKLTSIKKKGTIPIPAADLQFCLTKTNLDKPKISQWYK